MAGEVGKVGVAIDTSVTWKSFITLSGRADLDRIASNFTINGPAIYFIAMYVALAENRGISPEKLQATPQNDILKEYIARGAYIFPQNRPCVYSGISWFLPTNICPG